MCVCVYVDLYTGDQKETGPNVNRAFFWLELGGFHFILQYPVFSIVFMHYLIVILSPFWKVWFKKGTGKRAGQSGGGRDQRGGHRRPQEQLAGPVPLPRGSRARARAALSRGRAAALTPFRSFGPCLPGGLPPVIVYDHNGFRILLHFSQTGAPGHPALHVLLLTLMSTAPQPVWNISFQVAAPKVSR